MSQRRAQWEAIVEFSRAMLPLAEAGEWGELEARERQRADILHAFFAEPVTHADAEFVRPGIEEMLALNQRIMALGEAQRIELGGSMTAIHNGRRAVSAYSRNSR